MDWQPLAESDPVPGDPEAIAALASSLRHTAAELRDQVRTFNSFGNENDWQGSAGDIFRQKQKKIPDLFEKLATRYEGVATPLATYSTKLAQAQTEALAALTAAQQAQGDARQAAQGLTIKSTFEQQQQQAAVASGVPPQPWTGPDWQAQSDTAGAALSRAQGKLSDATSLRDSAASACAQAIHHATHDSLKDEGGFWGFIKRCAQDIASVVPLGVIAKICNGIAAVLAVVSLVIPIASPLLGALALVAGGMALACDTILWVAGEGSGFNVLMDAVGVATFGVGRVLEVGATVARAAPAAELSEGLASGEKSLVGFKVLSEEGAPLYGAAARSTTIKQLSPVVEESEGKTAAQLFMHDAFHAPLTTESAVSRWTATEVRGLAPLSSTAVALQRAGVAVDVGNAGLGAYGTGKGIVDDVVSAL